MSQFFSGIPTKAVIFPPDDCRDQTFPPTALENLCLECLKTSRMTWVTDFRPPILAVHETINRDNDRPSETKECELVFVLGIVHFIS